MKKIMFNDRYGLTQAVLEGRKTMTRREVKLPNGMTHSDIWNPVMGIDDKGKVYFTFDCIDSKQRDIYPLYRIGEEVWVAQNYKDLRYGPDDWIENTEGGYQQAHEFAGYTNKMFVRSIYLTHRIRITNIKAERLQDISDEDAMREGIEEHYPYIKWNPNDKLKSYRFRDKKSKYGYYQLSPVRDCFAELINRVSGKGTWERNPWVFPYEFELLK